MSGLMSCHKPLKNRRECRSDEFFMFHDIFTYREYNKRSYRRLWRFLGAALLASFPRSFFSPMLLNRLLIY